MSAGRSVDWKTSVLEDLVYQRVRQHVDLLSLIEFEQDLGDSIEHALSESGGAESEADTMGRRLLDVAWRRLEEEWREIRDAECPLCAAPYQCPVPLS